MTKAEYFYRQIKDHKLPFVPFCIKYKAKKQRITFIPGHEKDLVLFDFINDTVSYRKKTLPIKEVLPFTVQQDKSIIEIYIRFNEEPVNILSTFKDYSVVKPLMNRIEEVILREEKELENIDTQKTEKILRPITLHKEDELLNYFEKVKLPFGTEQIKKAKERIKDTDFIKDFLTVESADQTRRIYTRYVPMTLIPMAILIGLGWLAGMFWIYLSYIFYAIAAIVLLFMLFRIILPSMKGADALYYGKIPNYPQRMGIILPLIDPYFIHHIPEKNNFSALFKSSLFDGEFDVKFALSYSFIVDDEIIEKEYHQALEWIENNEKPTFQGLRDYITQAQFEGEILYVISSETGYIPDSTGLPFYRSELHPYRDNISIYHIEQLTPNRILLGYTGDGLIFIPYCKEFWQNISK